MTGPCCTGKARSGRLARRFGAPAASILPGVVLVLLPKCPLCLAAWLTIIAGTAVSATAAARLQGIIAAVCIGIISLAAARLIWRAAHYRRISLTLRSVSVNQE